MAGNTVDIHRKNRVLVVGATGQLGRVVLRKLVQGGIQARAFVRKSSRYQELQSQGIELAFGDLRDPASLESACKGVDAVLATANVVVPRQGRYSFEADEMRGYQNLIEACLHQGVKQFIFISVPVTSLDEEIPEFRSKRQIERLLQKSGISYTIFRATCFTDQWLTLFGSSIPLRGEEAATMRRPFWFARLYMALFDHLVEKHGLGLGRGHREIRHAFVTIEDVASFMVKSVGHPQAQKAIFDLGGPQILSWGEIGKIYGQVLGRPIRVLYVPAGFFRLMQLVLQPFSPAAANLMGLNRFAATVSTPFPMEELSRKFNVPLTSVEQFLRQKLTIQAAV